MGTQKKEGTKYGGVSRKVFAALFLGIIFFVSFKNFMWSEPKLSEVLKSAGKQDAKKTVTLFETTFNENFWRHSFWIDAHGGAQRVLNKYEVDNFDVIKDHNGFLHVPVAEKSADTLLAYADNLQTVYEYCRGKDISFLYAQAPSDYVPGKTALPWHMDDIANRNIDRFLCKVNELGIPNVDMREMIGEMSLEDIFYKTDHHWALPVSFLAFQTVVEHINADVGNKYTHLDNYTIESYPDSFLGSRGIRTGSWYGGRDLFRLYLPRYATDFINRYYVEDELQWEKIGSFTEAFIDEYLLHDSSYNNKYNVFMYGASCESRIINRLASDRDPKCLFISDSFGRQLVPYLSQCFHETAWIDPQPDRYTKSYLNYIEVFKPDCVVVLFNGNECYVEIPL